MLLPCHREDRVFSACYKVGRAISTSAREWDPIESDRFHQIPSAIPETVKISAASCVVGSSCSRAGRPCRHRFGGAGAPHLRRHDRPGSADAARPGASSAHRAAPANAHGTVVVMLTVTTMPEATFGVLLAEVEAGGTLVLREPNSARRDERMEDVRTSFCNLWMFARKTTAAKSCRMFVRVTVDDARELRQAGALWIGGPSADPLLLA